MDVISNIINVNPNLYHIFLIAILPVIELRGAIPIGLAMGLSSQATLLFSYIGSILPVPILFLCIKPTFEFLRKYKKTRLMIDSLLLRSIRKSDIVKKYNWIGLLIFVAIPLPGTGVWSGTLIANLLELKFRNALGAIMIGNLIAGFIILLISNGALKFIQM